MPRLRRYGVIIIVIIIIIIIIINLGSLTNKEVLSCVEILMYEFSNSVVDKLAYRFVIIIIIIIIIIIQLIQFSRYLFTCGLNSTNTQKRKR
jgi:hypothetical protein